MDKILKWCGFTWHEKRAYVHGYLMHGGNWQDGHWDYEGKCGYGKDNNHCISNNPPLDMNFFFKYVVPKLNGYEITKEFDGHEWAHRVKLSFTQVYDIGHIYEAINPDLNKAWQVALLKLISP